MRTTTAIEAGQTIQRTASWTAWDWTAHIAPAFLAGLGIGAVIDVVVTVCL